MSRKVIVTVLILASLAALGGVAFSLRPSNAPTVAVEPIRLRDLRAFVSASGTIQPKRSVDISASVMGRVTNLAVNEGDRVTAGQFLLQIDPESLQSAVERGEASLNASRSAREQAHVAVESARVNLALAQDTLRRQEELWKLRLISREAYEQAQNQVALRQTELRAREVEVRTAEQRIRQEEALLNSARYDLSQVTIVSPIDGIVTRRTIEEGETVVVGTMNNAGTVLMTIADFAILEAEVEVDETDVPSVQLGQNASITIDAFPDRTFHGTVTEIGNSPIEQVGQSSQGSAQATNFKVVVTLDGDVPGVRPGFTCTADITTATRTSALAVPIQATTVRDVVVDADGSIVTNAGAASPTRVADDPSERIEEVEGVFVVRDERVWFQRIQTGIAGERYFEALSGLEESDLVVTGPFTSVRDLQDGDAVTIE